MIARLGLGLILLSSLLIARPVVAQSPYFDQYIDQAKFLQLSPQDQRQFLLALMQTVADLEQKAIQSGRHLSPAEAKKTVHQQRWEQVKKALNSFQQLIVIPEAHAVDRSYDDTCHSPSQKYATRVVRRPGFPLPEEPQTCLFGSYRSTYVQSGNPLQTYCQRPSCSIDPQIRLEYDRIAQNGEGGGCKKSQMACNPALFGYESGNKATCVQLDVTHNGLMVNAVQNASLACLIAVTNDANQETRLNNIVTELKRNQAAATEFNRLLHTITNLCICDGSVGTDARVPPYLKDMSNDYSQYIKDHRTCNALLSQTSLVLKKIHDNGGSSCVSELLPQNVERLSQDLSYINEYSSRFYKLIGSNFTPGSIPKAEIYRAIGRYNARWVVDNATQITPEPEDGVRRVAPDAALDNVADYISKRTELKNRSAADQNKWCPLSFPMPDAPQVNINCTIASSSGTRTDNKVSLNAVASLGPLPTGVTQTSVAWTVNGVVLADQTAANLAAQNLESIPATLASVPVQATFTLSSGAPVVCSGAVPLPPAPVVNCEITPTVTYVETDANVSVTVAPTNATTVVTIGSDSPIAANNNAFAAKVPIARGSVTVNATIPAANGNPEIKCSKDVTLTAPPQTRCSLTIGETTEVNGKLNAPVSVTGVTGVSAINWTPALTPAPAASTGATVATSVTLTFTKPAAGAAQTISASAEVTTQGGVVRCDDVKTLAPPVVVAPEGCDLVLSVVAGNEGKYSVSATITSATGDKAPAPNTQPTFSGLSFAVDKNIGMALVDSKTEVQTFEITASYTDKNSKAHSCKSNAIIPTKAPAASVGGGAPVTPQGGPSFGTPVSGEVIKGGLQ
jgi:hypothetical protein